MLTTAVHHEECWRTPILESATACCDVMRCIGRKGLKLQEFMSMQGLLKQFVVSLNFKYSFWWWHGKLCCPSLFRTEVIYRYFQI